MRVFVLLFFFSGLFACSLKCQPTSSFSTIRFYEESGLNSGDIYGLTQDSGGYIWVGSNTGLYRFDGTQFQHFGAEDGVFSRIITRLFCLEDNSILAIGERPNAQYLISNDGNVTINKIGDGMVRGIAVHPTFINDGVHYIGSPGGHYGTIRTQEDKTIDIDRGHLPSHQFLRVYEPFQGRILLTHLGGGFYESSNLVIKKRLLPHEDDSAIDFFRIAPDKLLVLGEKYLYEWDGDASWKTIATHGVGDPQQVLLDSQGRIWVSDLHSSISMLSPGASVFRKMDKILDIENVQVTNLFEDQQENLWVSTAGAGLICLMNSLFTNYTMNDGLNSNYINSTHVGPRGRVWIGTNAGLNSIQRDGHTMVIDTFGNGYCVAVRELENGLVFSGVARSNYRGAFPYIVEGNNVEYTNAFAFVSLAENRIGIGKWWGFLLLDISKDEDGQFVFTNEKRIRLEGRPNSCLWVGNQGYFLTSRGLYSYLNDSVSLLLNGLSEGNSPTEFYDMTRLDVEHFVIASSKGLLKFNYVTNLIEPLIVPSISQYCRTVEVDKRGVLWVGTDVGLSSIFGSEIRTYTSGNGLPGNHVLCLDYDSVSHSLWIGTTQGVSHIDLAKLAAQKENLFPLYVSALEVIGDTILDAPNEVSLLRNQNHLRLHFRSLNYTNPSQVVYQYRLTGIQPEWKEGTTNVAEYLALAPGNYEFNVRSRLAGSPWGPISSISFAIASPFWHRWYFWFMIIVVLVVATVFLMNIRVDQVKRSELQKRKTLSTINRLELSALQSSMNPHFVFNSLNAIQHVMSKHKDPEAVDFVADFATLVRQNMEAARRKTTNLNREIDSIERYLRLEAIRLEGKLEYEIEKDLMNAQEEIEIPSMLIQPFIENSIWHGISPSPRHGSISLKFQQRGDLLNVTLIDNGVGLKKSQSQKRKGHISRGVELIRQRLNMLSGKNSLSIKEIQDAEGNALGTKVSIVIEINGHLRT